MAMLVGLRTLRDAVEDTLQLMDACAPRFLLRSLLLALGDLFWSSVTPWWR